MIWSNPIWFINFQILSSEHVKIRLSFKYMGFFLKIEHSYNIYILLKFCTVKGSQKRSTLTTTKLVQIHISFQEGLEDTPFTFIQSGVVIISNFDQTPGKLSKNHVFKLFFRSSTWPSYHHERPGEQYNDGYHQQRPTIRLGSWTRQRGRQHQRRHHQRQRKCKDFNMYFRVKKRYQIRVIKE